MLRHIHGLLVQGVVSTTASPTRPRLPLLLSAGLGTKVVYEGWPERVKVPYEAVEKSFVRSSGPGGQNVNKVSTKAELRFTLGSAEWLPAAVRQRMKELYPNRITKEGEVIVTSQVTRSQKRNLDDAIRKLQGMVDEACEPVLAREVQEGLAKHTKEHRIQERKKRSKAKEFRKKIKSWD